MFNSFYKPALVAVVTLNCYLNVLIVNNLSSLTLLFHKFLLIYWLPSIITVNCRYTFHFWADGVNFNIVLCVWRWSNWLTSHRANILIFFFLSSNGYRFVLVYLCPCPVKLRPWISVRLISLHGMLATDHVIKQLLAPWINLQCKCSLPKSKLTFVTQNTHCAKHLFYWGHK